MNKTGYILIAVLFVTFLNQIFTDFLFMESRTLKTKRSPAVKEKYEACLKSDPKYLKAMANLTYIYLRAYYRTGNKEELKKTIELLKKIESIDYYFPGIHYRRAQIHCEFDEWDEAIKEFNIAMELQKTDPEIHYDLGRINYFIKKDYEKAKSYFMQAIKYGALAKHKEITNFLQIMERSR